MKDLVSTYCKPKSPPALPGTGMNIGVTQAVYLMQASPDSQELVGKIIILVFIEVEHNILHRNAKILIILADFYEFEAAIMNSQHNKPHK